MSVSDIAKCDVTAQHAVETLARALYERFNAALKWLEPDWELLPDSSH